MAKRRKQYTSYVYSDGIVHGWIGQIPTPAAPLLVAARPTSYHVGKYADLSLLQVTNNGKVWSYVVRPMVVSSNEGKSWDIHFAGTYIPKDTTSHTGAPAHGHLEAAYRAPLEWARRDVAKRTKLPPTDPNALVFNCAYDIEAPQDAVVKLPGPCGPVTYTGIARKIGAYTIEQLNEIVGQAIGACIAVWTWRSAGTPPWKPSNLEVMVHDGARALGLAFAPGTGAKLNKRTISLNKKLLTQYDAHSIWRVIVHELCHHYRDEVFAPHEVVPAERETLLQAVKAWVADKGYRAAAQMADVLGTHDATFVRELGRVDSKIHENAVTGLVFTEYADQSLVAELVAKRADRRAKQQSKVSWDPTAGRLYFDRLKSGHFNVWWMPLTEGQWKPVREKLNNPQMRVLIARLGPDGGKTKVTYSKSWPSFWSTPDTLEKAVPLLEHNLGMFLGEIPRQ